MSSINSAGTNDLTEGANKDYTWDDPPAGLKTSALFASILRVPSGPYYIYLVADDGKNAPVFAVSSGPVSIAHSPIVQQVDPSAADTVDTGVRSGLQANPYDLDFSVVDYDSEARVQLFYAAVSGITSVSAKGVYPNQKFVLGKSLSGTRGTAIVDSTVLTSRDHEFSWDITSPLVSQGSYFLYAVATDSAHVTVGNSTASLTLRHSPSFVFFEPPENTQRTIDTGSQPIYTIQWQKGPGDKDLDHNANISLYFTTKNPATKNYAGTDSTNLVAAGDGNAQLIVGGLSENADGASDMYVWDFRDPPDEVPDNGQQVWIYAVISDGGGNVSVELGGSLRVAHAPYVLLKTRMPEISQGDIVRLEWDDYMVDDGSGTDNAYIRLYASTTPDRTTLQALEANVIGAGGGDDTYIINSSDGRTSGTITAIREDSSNAFNWDTWTSSLTVSEGSYSIYAGISVDATFSDNTVGRVSESSNKLVVRASTGTTPHLSLSPSKLLASQGDTLTFEVLAQSGGLSADVITVVVDLGTSLFDVQNSGTPFTDLGEVFVGGTQLTNSKSGNKIEFSKRRSGGEIIGTTTDPLRLASFKVVVKGGLSSTNTIKFDDEGTSLSIVGNSMPLKKSTGMSVQNTRVQALARGRLQATVLLEGRAPPIGSGDHATLLDVHLRLPGSTADIADSLFIATNDDHMATTDTVEVQTTSSGDLVLENIPAGRYVLAVKDTSHLSGRTDTLTIRHGETVILSSSQGFFASDIRGDPSFLLDQDGRELQAGDVTEDNEIDEDDVNAIDAAWGTASTALSAARADLNNDGRIGVEDLTVTTSNISNSTGFGAPPVFKPVARGGNASAGIEIAAPDFDGEWLRGQEVELVFAVRDLGDLAGYGFDLSYDPAEMDMVGEVADLQVARVFRDNPQGYFKRVEGEAGRLSIAAARRGKAWSARGEGELLRLRVRLFRDGFPRSLQLRDGKLLSSAYEITEMRLLNDPSALALPRQFTLGRNYPNPFNPSTIIPFSVPALDALLGRAGFVPVSVEIFNVAGQQVRTLVQEDMPPGYYRRAWDGRNRAGRPVGTGVYFYRVQVGETAQVGKMTLVK